MWGLSTEGTGDRLWWDWIKRQGPEGSTAHGSPARFSSASTCLGFRVSLGFRASGLRFRVSGFGFQISGFGFRVSGSGFRVLGFGFRDSGFGFRGSEARHC